MSLRVLIVDDEALARQQLRRFVLQTPGVEVVAECADGVQAVQVLESAVVDVAFLDIEMPQLDGFGVIDAVGAGRMPPVVFVTAFEEHALRAFRVHAVDYLLKPVDPGAVAGLLARFLTTVSTSTARNAQLEAALRAHPGAAHLRRLLVRSGDRLVVVNTSDIDWWEAADNFVKLHVGKLVYLTRSTMTELAERLDPAQFARIHRSYIVNLDRVRELERWFRGEYRIMLTDGTRLDIGPTYREQVLAQLRGD